jgi:thymidylate synthase
MFGQWIWVMRGSDDVEGIAFYNEKGRAFSDDGHHLSGSFGHRIRVRWGDQLQAAIARLRADLSTRRALVLIADPADVYERARDYPCAIAFQLLVRDSRLEAITTMRSQSALMVLPYDAPLFMTIHVWVAAVLGLEPGAHTWLAHSFHMYDDELELARAVLESPVSDEALPPVEDAEDNLVELFEFEEQVRAAVGKGERGQIALLSESWRTRDELHSAIGNVLLANAASLLGNGALSAEIADRLPPGLRRCMEVPRSRSTYDFIRTP